MNRIFILFLIIFCSQFVIQGQNKNNLYINQKYDFSLFRNPLKDSNIISFSVTDIMWIQKECPTTANLPDYYTYGEEKSAPQKMTRKHFVQNELNPCFIKHEEDHSMGHSYEAYYYVVAKTDIEAVVLKFVISTTNCYMYDDTEACEQNNERKQKIPDEYMKTFKWAK